MNFLQYINRKKTMKLLKVAIVLIISLSFVWSKTLSKAEVEKSPNFKTVGNVHIENTTRSSNSRTDTTTIFFDDMEGGTTDWTFGQGWAENTSSYSSPSTSLNIDDDNYGINSELISPVITLPDATDNELIKFSFDLWCDLPDSDGDGDNFLEDYYRVDVANLDDIPLFFHTSSNGAYSGNSWWCADPAIGGYDNDWLQFLDSPTISIPAGGATLSAQMKWGIEDPAGASVGGTCTNGWDAANVRISNDGGTTWYLLTGSDPYDFTDGYGWISNDPDYYDCQDLAAGWGNIQDWHLVTFDLSAYASQDVIIRFGFGADPGWSTADDASIDGLRIDDILVEDSNNNVLFEDDADDNAAMIPANGFDIQWTTVFYDYGDDSRPGGVNVGWETYMPGDPFNNNTQLDLTEHAGDDIQFRIVARIDDNDDGGNGSGLFIDDFHVWSVSLEESIPQITGVYAEAGDGSVYVSWNDINVGSGGDIIYDDGQFDPNESIIMSSGSSICGTLFDMPYGATNVTVNTVSVYGDDNSSGTTNIYGYAVTAGVPDENSLYSAAITTTSGQWTDVTVNWAFSGDYMIGYEITQDIASAIDTDVPGDQAHSWTNLGGWQDWTTVANSNGLSDGEWAIRSNVNFVGTDAVYNVYRSVSGSDYNLMFNGQYLSDAEYTDNLVQNDTEYCYKITAQYGMAEGPMSNASCAIPEAQTIHEIAYDDGTAETSTNVGVGNYMSVKMTLMKYPSEIKRVKFYVPTSSPGICGIRIWDDDGANGLPGTELTPSSGIIMQLAQGWNVKDLSNLGLFIGSGDIYIGWEETSNTPPIGIDLSDPDFRSYINIDAEPPVGTNGEWAELYLDGDFMVRVDVDSGVLAIGDDFNDIIPETFTLKQNYPNPFNPVTNIEFDLPEFAKTHLAVFDVTGREILTIVNNENLNAGHYRYQVKASELPSGMYFYRVSAVSGSGTKFSDTKKLVLLK